MTDPNVTETVVFAGTDGSEIGLHADHGRLVVGGCAMDAETAADFICEAAAILMEAKRREKRRLADEAIERAEDERFAAEAAELDDLEPL